MKILVIEDSQRLRISLRTGPCKLGCAVDLAEDGSQPTLRFPELL
jgi:DNA-binding response OmpR family regulator